MFVVKGIPILNDEIEILEALKQEVQLKLGKTILRKIKRGVKNIQICCPIHKDGQERRPSCGITTEQVGKTPPGMVHCFSCGYTATLDQMISDVFGIHDDGAFGRHWLMQNFIYFENADKRKLNINLEDIGKTESKSYISEQELQHYRFYHPYMFKRKLTEDVIQLFDVGYDKSTDSITFPVRDINGNCLFVSRRSVTGKHFYLPADIDKPLYGIYECSKVQPLTELYVCESQINALTCWVYGKPAVALFGTGNQKQMQALKNVNCRKLIIALDPDASGEKGVKRIVKNVRNKILYKAQVPIGKDINDLSYQEFLNLNLIELF